MKADASAGGSAAASRVVGRDRGAAAPQEGRAASVEVRVDAPVETVFALLTDPGTYPGWLVGAQEIRAVDDGWPEVGAAFHHSVGIRPLLIRDRTEIVAIDPPHGLLLEAHVGPLGRAGVRFELRDHGELTLVRLDEQPWSGPLGVAWRVAHAPAVRAFAGPLLRSVVWGRNALSLERFKALAER